MAVYRYFAGDDPGNFLDYNPGVRFGPNSNSWDAFSPRVGLDYQLNDDVLLFAFWQRAHKSGGFGNNAGTLPVFNSPFDQEQVDNFEIGMKSDWFDQTLRININAFYAKYHDLQRGVIREAETSTGQETFTDNAAGAESKGIELEFSWLPTEGLTIFGVVGYGMRSLGFPLAPMILGVVLGPIAERSVCKTQVKIARANAKTKAYRRSYMARDKRPRFHESIDPIGRIAPRITMNGVKAILKNGGPTESFLSTNISANMGQSVPMNTTKQLTASRILLVTNALSRLTRPKTPFASIAGARAA